MSSAALTQRRTAPTAAQLAVVAMTLVTIAVNVLANALPLFGRSTAEISDSFPALVTPAGYVFAIWGLIYLGLLAYAVWQALPVQAENPRVQAVAWPLVLAHAANTGWVFAWHGLAFGVTQLLMLLLLGSLMSIYLRLRAPARGVTAARRATAPSATERLLAHGTFSVYLGWITVATVANTTIWLMHLEWGGFGIDAALWATLTIAVATALGVRMLRAYRDLAYAAVLVWAFVGIVVMQRETALVAAAAVVGALTLAYVAALRFRGQGGAPS